MKISRLKGPRFWGSKERFVEPGHVFFFLEIFPSECLISELHFPWNIDQFFYILCFLRTSKHQQIQHNCLESKDILCKHFCFILSCLIWHLDFCVTLIPEPVFLIRYGTSIKIITVLTLSYINALNARRDVIQRTSAVCIKKDVWCGNAAILYEHVTAGRLLFEEYCPGSPSVLLRTLWREMRTQFMNAGTKTNLKLRTSKECQCYGTSDILEDLFLMCIEITLICIECWSVFLSC